LTSVDPQDHCLDDVGTALQGEVLLRPSLRGIDPAEGTFGHRLKPVDDRTTASAPWYEYQVSVLLFNRPDYARNTLESIRDQTLQLAPERLTLSVDGYAGSKDEALGKSDRTGEIAELAQSMFPGANVRTMSVNLGIARHFALVEQLAFDDGASEWATFLEEDFVLAPSYLEVMSRLIGHVDAECRIVQVSATGDTLLPETTDADDLRPMFHAWAFALRRSHYLERRGIIDAYLAALADVPYFQRDHDTVLARLVEFGLYPIGSAQDRVKQAVRKHYGKLAVTTAKPYGHYIGAKGEHFVPQTFSELGYDIPPTVPSEVPEFGDGIGAIVPRLVREDQRAWARELQTEWESRLRRATAHAKRCSAEAEIRLAEAVASAARAEYEASVVRGQLADMEVLLDAAENQVRSMLNSRSWRFTAGLRMFGGR